MTPAPLLPHVDMEAPPRRSALLSSPSLPILSSQKAETLTLGAFAVRRRPLESPPSCAALSSSEVSLWSVSTPSTSPSSRPCWGGLMPENGEDAPNAAS